MYLDFSDVMFGSIIFKKILYMSTFTERKVHKCWYLTTFCGCGFYLLRFGAAALVSVRCCPGSGGPRANAKCFNGVLDG